MYTCIDAAYAVHINMRSHIGGAVSIVHGLFHKNSSVQRLNTKSFREAELVGVSEYLPYNLWIMIFLHGKRYGIMNNILYQDNQIAIRMEENGRNSCTGNLRHINIR